MYPWELKNEKDLEKGENLDSRSKKYSEGCMERTYSRYK